MAEGSRRSNLHVFAWKYTQYGPLPCPPGASCPRSISSSNSGLRYGFVDRQLYVTNDGRGDFLLMFVELFTRGFCLCFSCFRVDVESGVDGGGSFWFYLSGDAVKRLCLSLFVSTDWPGSVVYIQPPRLFLHPSSLLSCH